MLEHHGDEGLVDATERRREGLFDAQVEDRFLHRSQVQGALAEPADGLGDGERALSSRPGLVAVDADGGDEADPLLVTAPYFGPQHAGGDHSGVAGRVEAAEGQRVPAGDDHERVLPRCDRQARYHVVRNQQTDGVGVAGPVDVVGGKPVVLRRAPSLVGAHTHHDVHSGVAQ